MSVPIEVLRIAGADYLRSIADEIDAGRARIDSIDFVDQTVGGWEFGTIEFQRIKSEGERV